MNFLAYESSIEGISVYDFLLEIRTSGFAIILTDIHHENFYIFVNIYELIIPVLLIVFILFL